MALRLFRKANTTAPKFLKAAMVLDLLLCKETIFVNFVQGKPNSIGII